MNRKGKWKIVLKDGGVHCADNFHKIKSHENEYTVEEVSFEGNERLIIPLLIIPRENVSYIEFIKEN